jgi:8-oxo-dGTP pyrophosphatase MutT (NUDIX family)
MAASVTGLPIISAAVRALLRRGGRAPWAAGALPLISHKATDASDGLRHRRFSHLMEAHVSKRVDCYDRAVPAANSLVVGSSAAVVVDEGSILLQPRSDSGDWALPGGAMDIGETFAQSTVREVREETGLGGRIKRIAGIYSDPATRSPMTTVRYGRSPAPVWRARLRAMNCLLTYMCRLLT